jgi:hypothetical protein
MFSPHTCSGFQSTSRCLFNGMSHSNGHVRLPLLEGIKVLYWLATQHSKRIANSSTSLTVYSPFEH